jgi:hypothetical protein
MEYLTIVAGVNIALRKIAKLNRLWLGGKQLGIRKKPHAIDVALEQSIQRSCWYIMWTVTYTTPVFVI